METRILMEVEEMINKIREQQGQPFDPRQLVTSCVANIIMNMLFGYRFDHSDPAFQQLMLDFNLLTNNLSIAMEIFPLLRFLPYFKNRLAQDLILCQNVYSFINKNSAKCIQACNFTFVNYQCRIHGRRQSGLFPIICSGNTYIPL